MLTSVVVTADSVDSARAAAMGQWAAQGYTRIEAVQTTVVGDRVYRVQANVTR